MTTYQEFLREKLDYSNSTGFDIELEQLHLALFPFQRHLTQWALKKGCAAIFADCGMGKTLMQLVWADHIVQRTNKPVLISGQHLQYLYRLAQDRSQKAQ